MAVPSFTPYNKTLGIVYTSCMKLLLVPIAFLLISLPYIASGMDYVSLTRDGKPIHLTGKVLQDAVDGGLLFQDREGIVWGVQPDEITKHSRDDKPYQPMRQKELQEKLAAEMPGFRIHTTAHYLICYNTSQAYAQWCGALYERLFWSFKNYWKLRGLELRDPDMPLVALIFGTEASYARYAKAELGDATGNVVGYYSFRTNRMTMFDLTKMNGLQNVPRHLGTSAQINLILMQPGAERMVATIIHEATHQLAYNCGMHQRYADIPLWVAEGLAVFFETPDLRSKRGWKNIGGVNRLRLNRFRKYPGAQEPDTFRSLLVDDNRFRMPDTALDSYAVAWSLNHYLIHRRCEQYVKYLNVLARNAPLLKDTPEGRLDVFAEAFGQTPAELQDDFLRYMKTVR